MATGKARKRGIGATPGALAVLLVALLALIRFPVIEPAVDRLGFLVFDGFERSSPRHYRDAAVRVVDIDEETIRRLGQWPWPRTDIARLNDALAGAGAAAIAYDIVFSEADRTSPPALARRLPLKPAERAAMARLPDNDAVLAKSFSASPVVTGLFLTRDPPRHRAEPKAGFAIAGSPPSGEVPAFSDAIQPIAPLSQAASGNGFVSIVGDRDAVVRRAPLLARQSETLMPSLALDALRVAQGAGSITVKTSDGSGEMGGRAGDVVGLKVGQFEVPTTAAGELWMHYTPPVPDRVVPAWKILSGAITPADMQRLFGGHIVFVGAGAIGLRDLVSTPLADRELGVMVHAQAVEQMVLGDYLVRPDWAPGLELVLLLAFGFGLVAALPRIGAVRGFVLGALAIAGLVGGSWVAFTRYHFLLDPSWPLLAVAFGYTVSTVATFYREERQRAYIHHAFDRYLSPELVKRIADDPSRLELGGEEREMTVLFADIRGFSRIAEGLAPNQVIDFMVRFLTPMTDLLLARRATIDKYIGDAILAFWNAPLDDPDQHRHAAEAALAMQARLAELNAEAARTGDSSWPGEVRIGVGLNCGPCCVGNIGSARRLSYSLIGDPVNLASRIEGLTKYYGVPILVGGTLANCLGDFALVPVDLVRVVGRAHPEPLFALAGDAALARSSTFVAFAKTHEKMIAAYRERAFDESQRLCTENSSEAARLGFEPLYELYAERIAHFLAAPPPADWDGVHDATRK